VPPHRDEMKWDETASQRALKIRSEFQRPGATAAWLLCDRHPVADVALRFVAEDLSVLEMTYGRNDLAMRVFLP